MNKIILSLSALGVLVLFGIGCTSPRAKGMSTVAQDFSLEYNVNGCYGNCPVYSIKIKADGTAAYEGVQHVEIKGMRQMGISQQDMEKITQKIDRIKFFSLEDGYICDQTGDAGRRSIKVTENGKAKTIVYDCGTSEINELQSLIENATKIRDLVSVSIDPTVCVERYSQLKRDYDTCKEDLGGANQAVEALRQKDEGSKQVEGLWKRIASSSNDDKRWIGVALMTSSTNTFYAAQWDQTMVVEKKKSPSGKQTLVVFGQKYDSSSPIIQRGFYILNDKGEFIDSYVVPDVWEHFSIGDVVWKNERVIAYNYYLATEGDEIHPPEKREFALELRK